MFLVAIGVQAPASAQTSVPIQQFDSFDAAVPGIVPTGAKNDAIYLDAAGSVISQQGANPDMAASQNSSETQAAAFGCTPVSGRDNPHYSSGDVSGHGWWKKGNCTGATAARVQLPLRVLYGQYVAAEGMLNHEDTEAIHGQRGPNGGSGEVFQQEYGLMAQPCRCQCRWPGRHG